MWQGGMSVRQRSLTTLGVSLLAASVALAGCGSRSEEGGGGGTTGGGGGGTTVKIGVIAPLSGELSALGLGIKNSVDLAIKQANEDKTVEGVTFELAAEDDQATPDVGRNAATKLAADEEVIGVVGTLNSSVAQTVQPVLDRADVLMVSPANTNPALTQGNDWQNAPKRLAESYFRTATTDAVQGPFAAQYLFNDAKIQSVAVVHDKKTYGQGLSGTFSEEFTRLGGKIVATETVNPGDKDFAPVINKIAPLKPGAVYYGGEYPEAQLLSPQMKDKGLNIPLMGGDGIYSGVYLENVKAKGNGDLATSVGAPTESLESAKDFVSAYSEAGYKEEYEAYGAYSYDAAKAIIEATKKAMEGKDKVDDSVRQAAVQAMADVTFEGATGQVEFDEFGDTTNKTLTVYKVDGGKWVPVKTGELQEG